MNKQITEDYVSFEIAKLLKEKGFDIPIHAFYNPKKSYMLKIDTCLINRNAGIYVSAPTHQMALKWLREVHGKIILINFCRKERYSYDILLDGECGDNYILYSAYMFEHYQSYEKAVEAAIKYTLENLI